MLFRYDIKTSNQHFMAKPVVSSKRHLRKGKALMAKLKTKEMYEEDEDFPKDEEASQQFAILILEILFYLDLYIYIYTYTDIYIYLMYILTVSLCTLFCIHHIRFHMFLYFPMMVSSCQAS